MSDLTSKPKLPETIIVKGRPSNDLLRYWAKDPEQNQCWGLDVVADEIDRLTRREAELEKALRTMMALIHEAETAHGTELRGVAYYEAKKALLEAKAPPEATGAHSLKLTWEFSDGVECKVELHGTERDLKMMAARMEYYRRLEEASAPVEPEGPCLFDRLVGNPLDMLKTDCAHDFTFTENKDYGWCVKCKTEYDFAKHGIV